jgi:hypothetical protein
MKAIKWIGHPVLLVIIYLLLIIEGDQFGGFFMLYLLLALPHFVPYALAAALGIACIVLGFNLRKGNYHSLKPMLFLSGYCLMILSLLVFFSKGNKWETFELAIPILTFVIFGISSLCFLINTTLLFSKKHPWKRMKTISET